MLVFKENKAQGFFKILKRYIFPRKIIREDANIYKSIEESAEMYQKNLIFLLLKLIMEVGFTVVNLDLYYNAESSAEKRIPMGYWDDSKLLLVNITVILVKFSKILLVPLYYK